MITGTSGSYCRSQSSSLMPSISGMIMSLKTRSGVTRFTWSCAARPLLTAVQL